MILTFVTAILCFAAAIIMLTPYFRKVVPDYVNRIGTILIVLYYIFMLLMTRKKSKRKKREKAQ